MIMLEVLAKTLYLWRDDKWSYKDKTDTFEECKAIVAKKAEEGWELV